MRAFRDLPGVSQLLKLDPQKVLLAAACLLLASTFLFPVTGAAGLALLILIASAGALLAGASLRVSVEAPPWLPDALVVASVLATSSVLFFDAWSRPGLHVYDWAPHHANLKHLVDGLRKGGVPHWVQSVSTGDSPYELYPLLPYYLMAKAAIITHARDLTLVMQRTAIITHTVGALGAALLARRFLAWPFAVLVGFVMLFDSGSAWGGGMDGLFGLGVLHSAMASAVWPFALGAVVDALRRPRLATTVRLWLTVALSVALHPIGLVSALVTSGALVLVALLASDIPRRRALFTILHVALAATAMAFVWMPLSQRLVLYGVHYGVGGRLAWDLFGQLLTAAVPESAVGPLVYAGYLGAIVGILSRRAAPTLIACHVAILASGLFDQLYVLLDLVPSLEGSRFQTVRLPAASKAYVYVLGAYLVELALTRVRPKRLDLGWLTLGAVLTLGTAGALRGAVPHFDRLAANLRGLTQRDVPDSDGLRKLADWAREQNEAMTPGRFGRLLHEDDRRFYSVYHVNALSGLPTLWVGPVSCLFLRERIEDSSPASLRRFDVRWVMHRDGPPSLGDPATERRFGRYFVRELPDWDGRFARVERGEGNAIVTKLENELVEVELRDTDKPALVALGMGYYPRWQATHSARGQLPVYALPSIPGAKLHIAAAWLPPGRTTFRADGPLPSDGRGTWPSLLACLLAFGGVVVWRQPRTRVPVLRWLSRALGALQRQARELALVALALAAVGLFVLAWRSSKADSAALQIGNGLVSLAEVSTRGPNRAWRDCHYSLVHGAFRCPGPLLVQDSVADQLEDAPPSPPFSVPAIVIAASVRDADVRVRLSSRLAGEYWAIATGGEATLSEVGHGDRPAVQLNGTQQTLSFPPSPEARELLLEATVPAGTTLKVSVVRRDRLDPDRHYPVAPEASPFR